MRSCQQWIFHDVVLGSMFVTYFAEYVVKYFVKCFVKQLACGRSARLAPSANYQGPRGQGPICGRAQGFVSGRSVRLARARGLGSRQWSVQPAGPPAKGHEPGGQGLVSGRSASWPVSKGPGTRGPGTKGVGGRKWSVSIAEKSFETSGR